LQPLVQALADELRRHMVLHADETPVAMLKPGNGKTHKAYIWSYCTPSTNPIKAVVFEFSETRSGENVRDFLRLDTPNAWQGTLVTDGFSGYSACVDKGVTSASAWRTPAQVPRAVGQPRQQGRRAGAALLPSAVPDRAPSRAAYRRGATADAAAQVTTGPRRLPPMAAGQRQLVPPGSATIKAIDYSLKRWKELTHFVSDGDVPISNNWVENQIRPIASADRIGSSPAACGRASAPPPS
jgi:hypothetical protein